MRLALAAMVAFAATSGCAFLGDETSEVADQGRPETPRHTIADDAGVTEAVVAGETVYLSGLGPADPNAPIADQTASAMDRLGAVLGKAGLDHSHVVSCHVHLADMDAYAGMNSVYGSYFAEGSYPARTTVEMPGLPGGAGVMLMCVAFADSAGIEVVRPPADEIPPAMGPYSPAVRAGNTVYVSGQGGRDPITGEIGESAGEQAAQTLENIGTILKAAGLAYDNTVLASSYFPPMSELADIDGALGTVFSPGGAPSRTNVALSRLPGDIAVEITFVAVEDNYVTRLFMHDEAPTSVRSPASLSGGVIYVSSVTGEGESFQQQLEGALDRQRAILALALMDSSHVVRVTAYLADLSDLQALRSGLVAAFPDGAPALTALQARHPAGTAVALDAIAVQ